MRNILEQMSQWESFVDVVNQVAEVIGCSRRCCKKPKRPANRARKEVFDEKP